MKRAVYTVFATTLALVACNQSIPEDVPCKEDTSCPTSFYCSSVGTCLEASAQSSPPNVQILGVTRGKEGDPEGSITLSAKGRLQMFYIVIRNAGGSQAPYPEISLKGPKCLDIEGSLGSNLIGIMEPGSTTTASVYADPDRDGTCLGTKHVEVSIEVGGGSVSPLRKTTGAFDVVLQ